MASEEVPGGSRTVALGKPRASCTAQGAERSQRNALCPWVTAGALCLLHLRIQSHKEFSWK